jgi:uncharacterized protein YodC (DUF2158 family)
MLIMANAFDVGDVVELKSGGPKMTIEGIGEYRSMTNPGETQANCSWFEKNKKLQELFDLKALKKSSI